MVHDHGPIGMPALFDELRGGADAPMFESLIERLGGFIEVDDPAEVPAQIAAAIRRLRIDAVEDEMRLLAETGDWSDADRERYRHLETRRSALHGDAAG